MKSLYEILRSAKCGAGAAPDFHTAVMAQKMPFAKGSGAEHEYTGAVPVTFTANGQPLLDYLISGNTTQNGTPTPDNPIMPQGTGDRTGNLWDPNSRTNNQAGQLNWGVVLPAGTYTIKNDSNVTVYFRNGVNATTAQRFASAGDTATKTTTEEMVAWCASSQSNIMLNSGSTPLPYEPNGYKIPISSANTTTPVYLGEVETTRWIRKLVFDGTESIWRITGTGRLAVEIPASAIAGQYCFCTHYKGTNVTSLSNLNDKECEVGSLNSSNKQEFAVYDTQYTSAADFRSYLAQQYANGTPVCVWYVLANEETGVVNEPLMKIGEYADTVSMEQAGVEIPTARGTNTLDVLTDVKPSEIYIKYKS